MSESPTGGADVVQGAWIRRSAAIEGGSSFETQLVVWLQAGPCYADLRVPLHPDADQRCFSGRSFWEADGYRWTHHLDFEAANGVASPSADDLGQLTWTGDALVETGMFATSTGPVSYEEVWSPLPGGGGPHLAVEAPDGCLVRVGRHAITVVDRRGTGGEFAACYRVLGAQGWRVEAAIGSPECLPAVDEIVNGWTVVHNDSRARATR
jgi:hypothetical protein